ncbi:hypothetical protein N7505_004592 [Penicillium chrysogenum]|uniref:Uncharacterized protein n=1 Tax=Penicillium chrysogenum TaxID=5076 RepID=A0ABQ8WFP4_PENCH|nr:hypothetical protein N7505_004592 [Penicillium chrysogenum]
MWNPYSRLLGHQSMEEIRILIKLANNLSRGKYSGFYGMNNKKRCASSVNRTRASSMATTNSTTRPMMLEDQVNQRADSLVIFAVP